METATEIKISDDFQTDWSFHLPDARTEMYENASCITQKIEHLIDNEDSTLLIDNLDIVYKAIQQLKNLADYNYTGDRINRWDEEYSDTFEYNFTTEVKDLLSDDLGYVWEEK